MVISAIDAFAKLLTGQRYYFPATFASCRRRAGGGNLVCQQRLVGQSWRRSMTIRKVSSKGTEACPTGEVSLVVGNAMAMRMWQDEEPQAKRPHRSPYETLGYVISGNAELTVEGQTVSLEAGDSWLVPANAEHKYRIIETFTAIECTSPPAIAAAF